jgi:hypothetical protein
MALVALVSTQSPVAGQPDVEDIQGLRDRHFHSVGVRVNVREHTAGCGFGGGEFECVSLSSTGYVDDNGFQIITGTGQVMRRVNRDQLSSDKFGAIGGEDIKPVLDNMFKASRTFNIQDAIIKHPSNGIAYTHSGGNVFDVSDGVGWYLRGLISGGKGVPINHTGQDGICMRFRMDQPNTTSFYERAGVFGILLRGRNSSNTAAGNNGFGIEVSDIRGFQCDVFITGYTNPLGGAISIYNDTGFTELGRYNAMIRGCANGVVFHRNVSAGSTSTNSFMGTELNIDYQAGVSGVTNTGIRVMNLDGSVGTNTFDLNLYASTIRFRYWAEGGSTTNGILVGAKGLIPESTKVELISDGYGFGTSDTDTTTEPATRLIRVENGGIFRAKCIDQSMQTGTGFRLNQLQRLRNSVFSFQDDTYKFPYTDARPYINPTGMSFTCSGTIAAAVRVTGGSWMISGLPMGMQLRVSVYQYNEGESLSSKEVWDVFVLGDAQSCVCVPVYSSDILSTTTGTAVVNSAGDTATFLKSVASAPGRYWQGSSTRTRLTVRNVNDDNSSTTGASDGRKFRLWLPATPGATSDLHYTVKVEVV